ncbi:MAG: transmembrane 220 family protein [Acidobacteriota bacterium]
MRFANILMTICFLLSAAVQYNDPDPIGWGLIYGAAALACMAALAGRLHWIVPAVIAAAALVWALTILPRVTLQSLGGMFESIDMISYGVEEAREAVGLLIVAGWMTVLAWKRVASRESRVAS